MKLKINEKGFTLVELVVVVAIVGTITGVMAMTIITMMQISPKSRDQANVLRQVQNAGFWISRDVLMARDIVVDEDPATPQFLTLVIPVVGAADKTMVYQLQDMADGMKRLVRTELGTGEQKLVSEYIYYDPNGDPDNSTMIINYQSPVMSMRFTANYGEAMASKQYEAMQRVPAPSD